MSDRFWEKVEKRGECWLWKGCEINGLCPYPHQLAYRAAGLGMPPTGIWDSYTCGNRTCVNPRHLIYTTRGGRVRPNGVEKYKHKKKTERPEYFKIRRLRSDSTRHLLLAPAPLAKKRKRGDPWSEDLTGQCFGRLTVVKRVENTSPVKWIVRCKCGKEKTVRAGKLQGGQMRGCGMGCPLRQRRPVPGPRR